METWDKQWPWLSPKIKSRDPSNTYGKGISPILAHIIQLKKKALEEFRYKKDVADCIPIEPSKKPNSLTFFFIALPSIIL
jgi:hypothetical protein